MRTALRLLLSIAIAAALLAALFAWGNLSLEELWETWRRLPLEVYLLALGIHLVIYALRSARFAVLLPGERRPDQPRLLAISAAHNMAALLLPAKTGEAVLPVYLKRLCGVAASDGLATLVVSRLLDLAVLCTILACACLWMSLSIAEAPAWMLPLALGLAVAAAFGVVVSARGDLVVRLLAWMLRATHLGGTRLGRKLDGLSHRVAESLRAAGGARPLVRGVALSLPLWALVFVFLVLLGHGFGLQQPHGPMGDVFGAACSLLAHMLPISVFAGVGTQEAGWMVGFQLLGVPEDQALSTGLGVYTVFRLNVVLLGLLGHLAMSLLGAAPQAE